MQESRDYRGYHGLNVPKESEICDAIYGNRSSRFEIIAPDIYVSSYSEMTFDAMASI